MASDPKRRWQNLWWRGQAILWGGVILSIGGNLLYSWLTVKQWDVSGTPLGWLLANPVVLALGSILLLFQTLVAYWATRPESPSQASSPLEQRDDVILRVCDELERAQPGPRLPSVGEVVQRLQTRYAVQDILDALEWLERQGDLELRRVFGNAQPGRHRAEAWSFRLTPQGKRARALMS